MCEEIFYLHENVSWGHFDVTVSLFVSYVGCSSIRIMVVQNSSTSEATVCVNWKLSVEWSDEMFWITVYMWNWNLAQCNKKQLLAVICGDILYRIILNSVKGASFKQQKRKGPIKRIVGLLGWGLCSHRAYPIVISDWGRLLLSLNTTKGEQWSCIRLVCLTNVQTTVANQARVRFYPLRWIWKKKK